MGERDFRIGRSLALALALGALAICAYAGGAAQGSVTLKKIKPLKPVAGKPAAANAVAANIGQTIRLVGTGFGEDVTVQFTGFSGSAFVVRPLRVTAGKRAEIAVPGTAVTGPVLLVDGSNKSEPLTLQVVPSIISLSPTTIAPGGRLLIDGSGFARDARVLFKGVTTPVEPTIVSPTRIDVVVPQGAKTGAVAVVTSGGKSKGARMTVAAAPAAAPAPKKPPR